MTKSELINAVMEKNVQLATKKSAEESIKAVLETITRELLEGNQVGFKGFGVFGTRMKAPRLGRNPKTGEAVKIEEKRVPFFRPSQSLKQSLNESKG